MYLKVHHINKFWIITLAAVMADVDEAGVVGGVTIGSSITTQPQLNHNHHTFH